MPSGETRATVKAKHGKDHHLGFNDAMELALSQLSTDIGTGTYTVTIEFEAEVKVTNPGVIGYYSIKMTA